MKLAQLILITISKPKLKTNFLDGFHKIQIRDRFWKGSTSIKGGNIIRTTVEIKYIWKT